MNETEVRILQAIERSSMVSTWKEYLCIEWRNGRAVLSHRRYDVLGELSDFAVETDEGDEECRIPEFIDGKRVAGTEDDFIVGGELTVDPSDSEPEINLGDVNRHTFSAWLTGRGFELSSELEEIWERTSIETRAPNVLGREKVGELHDGESPVQALDAAVIAPVTHLRIRLKRWMDLPVTAENDYPAEVIKDGDKYYYKARGATVPITAHEAEQVVTNPLLYYFSTALKLHKRIDAEKAPNPAQLRTLIDACCPDWEVVEQRTREDWCQALKEQFAVSGYQKDGMDEPVEFEVDSLEFREEPATIGPLHESSLADWLGDLHDPAVQLGSLVRQLQDLAARAKALQLTPTVLTAGMKYCGTITSARIRVTMKGCNSTVIGIRPVDCNWESYFDRTFGPMWESPDDR